jgi:hypothetical protein
MGQNRLILSNGWRGDSTLQENRFIHTTSLRYHKVALMPQKLRMLKKAVQQGRSERRGEAYVSVR